MSANAIVRARVDEHIKEEATAVLAAMGLTVSDAFRIMLTRVAHDKDFPLAPLTPNETTIAAKRGQAGSSALTAHCHHPALSICINSTKPMACAP